jgi:hypothetical protein
MRGRAPIAALLAALAACRQDMHDQPKAEPFEGSRFFEDGRTARPRIEGTVARGELSFDRHLQQGKVGDAWAETFPFEVTREVLERGRERFGIFCAPCHDAAGTGAGAIVERGMKRPPSMHVERLREAPPGYLFDVIGNGFGAMLDYGDRIDVRDRWAIVAYERALQLSQSARLEDLTPEERRRLEEQR